MSRSNPSSNDDSVSKNNSSKTKGNHAGIRARNETDRRLLVAAVEGDIAYLESIRKNSANGTDLLRNTVCTSGCHLVHWAAGSNRVDVLEYLFLPLEDDNETSPNENEDKDDNGNDNDTVQPNPVFANTDTHRAVDLPVTRCRKSWGRTPLHYASRNGCLQAVQWLVREGGASIAVQAKQGVTPFQLAVWQNRLDICRFLVQQGHDAGKDFNHFGCGAVHWLGIAPESRANFRRRSNSSNPPTKNGNNGTHENDDNGSPSCSIESSSSNSDDDDDDEYYNDGRDLLPLAQWLASLEGIDFGARQRQNHTALHKAAWGGHLSLIKYLHTEQDMWDEFADDAGNFAASLADMANTTKHSQIATYLRHHCSRKRASSLAMLGLSPHESDPETIRRAYLRKARQLHPDRLVGRPTKIETTAASLEERTTTVSKNQNDAAEKEEDSKTSVTTTDDTITFDQLRKAYIHLTEEGGVGDQSNPAHSLNLMLQYVNNNASNNNCKNTTPNETGVSQVNVQEDSSKNEADDDAFFKARLVAVLLEYGDKGIDLSNVKKKWKQVWPKVPFPSQVQKQSEILDDTETRQKQQQSSLRKISMAEFLMQRAGDVIRFERHGDRKRRILVLLKDRNSTKEQVLQSGTNPLGERQ